jgi:hypothetical protein
VASVRRNFIDLLTPSEVQALAVMAGKVLERTWPGRRRRAGGSVIVQAYGCGNSHKPAGS